MNRTPSLALLRRSAPSLCAGSLLLTALGCSSDGGGGGAPAILAAPARSTNIALSSDDRFLVVANRDADTLTVLGVRDAQGGDQFEKLAEVAVGDEPRAVALAPDDATVYVANTASGTVSVIRLGAHGLEPEIAAEIPVGTEPRGLALTPTGTRLYVANHTAGTVSVIDTGTLAVTDTIQLAGNPTALAVTNDGDADDLDETVFVTQFFAELVPLGPGETFDDGKQGVVWSFPTAGGAPAKTVLSPLANAGFTADRAPFCADFNANIHSEVYCPDVDETDPLAPAIAADPQGAFPNQLHAALLRDGILFVPSIAASPEPPVRFTVNVQALVHEVDAQTLAQIPVNTVNLNAQIRTEVQPPVPTESLDRLFANDVVALDATLDGDRFFFVSRGGNCVIEAGLDATLKLTLGAPDVVRYQTGNIPTGIAVSADGTRAYVYNEVNLSVSALDLGAQTVLERDVAVGTPPVPGTFAHGVQLGKLAFHTALGLPDSGIFGTPVRDIVPLQHRGKASADSWSDCASCHPDGLSDNVTWIFGTGPRQTLSLDAFFSKLNPADQRISNWSAVMGSITDFNNNARGVQGGLGFAGNPPPATIFQHGVTEGASESLDAMTLWVQTVRSPILPEAEDVAATASGEFLFQQNCASCHGGAKWTKSQVVYDNNPTFDADPNGGAAPLDPGVTNALAQIRSFTEGALTLDFLELVGTFDPTNPLEIRGQAPQFGQRALGQLGFNVPSLLGLRYFAPFLHDGSAQTLDDVFARHDLGAQKIAATFSAQELADLKTFLLTIDASSSIQESEADVFLEALGL
jgi:YVTN family beta-propeller protein